MSERRAPVQVVDRDYLDARLDTVNAELNGLRAEMAAQFARVDTRLDALHTEMTTRFELADERADKTAAQTVKEIQHLLLVTGVSVTVTILVALLGLVATVLVRT